MRKQPKRGAGLKHGGYPGLRELQQQNLTRDELLLKLGAAKKEAGKAYALLVIHTPTKDQPVTSETFHFVLDRKKLRQARRREGGYLLRSNIKSDDPGDLSLSAIGRGRAGIQGAEERSVDPSSSITSSKPELKHIFSLRFWLIVCWSR